MIVQIKVLKNYFLKNFYKIRGRSKCFHGVQMTTSKKKSFVHFFLIDTNMNLYMDRIEKINWTFYTIEMKIKLFTMSWLCTMSCFFKTKLIHQLPKKEPLPKSWICPWKNIYNEQKPKCNLLWVRIVYARRNQALSMWKEKLRQYCVKGWKAQPILYVLFGWWNLK